VHQPNNKEKKKFLSKTKKRITVPVLPAVGRRYGELWVYKCRVPKFTIAREERLFFISFFHNLSINMNKFCEEEKRARVK
jgi:hypothetical protein